MAAQDVPLGFEVREFAGDQPGALGALRLNLGHEAESLSVSVNAPGREPGHVLWVADPSRRLGDFTAAVVAALTRPVHDRATDVLLPDEPAVAPRALPGPSLRLGEESRRAGRDVAERQRSCN